MAVILIAKVVDQYYSHKVVIKIRLTEYDKNLFRLIAISGTCTLEQARQVYKPFSNNQWYHYKRIQRLEENGHLIKRGSYLELTKRSAEIIGETKYRFRHDGVREAHAEITDIVLSLGLDFVSNRQLRTEYSLNRKTYFKGAVIIDGYYYFLYLLSDKPSSQHIGGIQAELRTYSSSGITRKAIVFAPTPTAMSMFGDDSCRQDELFLLPYPSGLNLLNNYFTPETQEYLKSLFPNAVTSRYPFANYETISQYVTILVLNDIAKRNALTGYFKSPHQPKPVTIICLESQKQLFASHYPKAKLITLPETIISRKASNQ